MRSSVSPRRLWPAISRTGAAGDRYQVVVQIGPMVKDGRAIVDDHDGPDVGDETAVIEAERQLVDVSAETSRRLACDASLVAVRQAVEATARRRPEDARGTRGDPARARRP